MTSQSSGGSGSGLPGVTSDGLTPGGEKIAGALTAGDPNAASVPSRHKVYGWTDFRSVPGTYVDDDDVLDVHSTGTLPGNWDGNELWVGRGFNTNGFDCTGAVARIQDTSASTHAVLEVAKGNTIQFQVDGDGVQVHGKFKTGAAVTHTLGAYSGKSLPIYDESGTLVGYAPCYA